MVVLAVDYGYVRTGLAVCDVSETLCSPAGIITESYMPKVASKIAEICNECCVEKVVVGLPKNMDGTEGEHAEKSRELAAMLRELGLTVDLYDERLTTVVAHSLLSEAETFGKKRKSAVDQVAATIILEDYLKSKHLKDLEDK
ncbi:MAG: Holliday junction resolvase RuvX [Ruminococcaceae bacterium]|nr:Holliday junction resolvase RuvX [Oscillospiraceae bacterium]